MNVEQPPREASTQARISFWFLKEEVYENPSASQKPGTHTLCTTKTIFRVMKGPNENHEKSVLG